MGKYFPKIYAILRLIKGYKGYDMSGVCMNGCCKNKAIINMSMALGVLSEEADPFPFYVCEECYSYICQERNPELLAYRKFKLDRGIKDVGRQEVMDLVKVALK